METRDAIRARRSIRRFTGGPVPADALRELLDLARYYPSAGNRQPLKFAAFASENACAAIFARLHWAAYLKDFAIAENQRPRAYILIFGDRSVAADFGFSCGAAAEAILLGAVSLGLCACCLGLAEPAALAGELGFPADKYELLNVIALGCSAQKSRAADGGGVRYYEDADGGLVVPKRPLSETVLRFDAD